MAIHSIAKKEFVKKISLCDTCGNAVPQLCAFIREKESESALASIGAEAVSCEYYRNPHFEVLYKVTSCPSHILKELPSIGELAHKTEPEYDLSCPECGSDKNVKIAGIYEYPQKPDKWYCRCSACNKSFRPRKREVKKMESHDNFTVYKPKKPSIDQSVKTKSKPSSVQTRHDEHDEIEWAKPMRQESSMLPILRIYDKGISFNACAMRSLQEVRYLRIGVDLKNKSIILVPSKEKDGCYSCRPLDSEIKTGGSGLVKFFKERGINLGKYLLNYNAEKNRWETRTEGGN